MDDLTQFDLLLDDGFESRGYLVSWEGTESEPFALVVEEQAVPESVSANQEDENYGFRDLQDTWRVSYTNFSGGEGQERRDVTGGTPVKYHRSESIDISTPGMLRLHHAPRQLEYSGLTSLLGPTSVFGVHQGRIIWSREGRSESQFMSLGSYHPETGTWAHWAPIYASIWPRVTALASDGTDLYVACTDGDADKQGIWKYSDPLMPGTLLNQTTDATGCKTIDRMCFSAGILYLSSNGQIGYLKFVDDEPDYYVFEPLSPVTLTAGRTCFGMVASETWVYVGMTSGSKSVVYRTQWNPAEQVSETIIGVKHFEQYAELPEGFVGSALVESLDNIFICGTYRGRHGAEGQGVVYLASGNGLALLCRIGDDPNEKRYLEDRDHNSIIAGYASEHWLYLLTKRSLYRWNVRNGGLNQIADMAVFPPVMGSHGTVVTIPWDFDESYWTGYAHTTFLPNDMPALTLYENFSAMESEWDDIRRSPLYAEPDTSSEVVGVRVNSNTADKYGHRRFHRNRLRDSSFAAGGAMEFVASSFWRNCLELEVTSATHCACIMLRGAEDSDIVRVYYYDSNGGKTQLTTLGGENVEHSFFLSCDPVTGMASLWIDGATTPKSWRMPASTYEPGCAYTFGADRLVSDETQDWWVVPDHMRWAGGDNYVPGWTSASGTVGAFSFAVVDGLPYVPVAPDPPTLTGGNALVTLDWDSYADRGELWTSISSAQMPTVDKFITALDVHYDPPADGDYIEVMPLVNGTTMSYPLVITGEDDGNIKSLPLPGSDGARGTEVQLLVTLVSGNGRTTPVFRGGSLRFSPLDNSYYLLRLDLRDARKDNTGRMTDTAADIAFLKEVAESKKVVTMTTPLESCRVRVSTLQFLAAAPLRGAEVNPQGIALVRLKRIT